MDFLQKYFYRVFELPLPRNAQKRAKKKSEKKKSGGLVGSSKVNQIYVEVRPLFFLVPLDIVIIDTHVIHTNTNTESICDLSG
jgi:hypothetical protein